MKKNMFVSDIQSSNDNARMKIQELNRIIDQEMKKPDGQVDTDLITECLEYINELEGNVADLDGAALDARMAKTVENAEKSVSQRRIRRPWVIAVAAVICVGLLSACAAIPAVRDWIREVMLMPVGTVMQDGNIEYINKGQVTAYRSVAELAEQQGICFFFPQTLPKGYSVTSVITTEVMPDKYTFVFQDTEIGYSIQRNFEQEFVPDEIYTLLEKDGISIYHGYHEVMEKYLALFVCDNVYYSVTARQEEDLLTMLSSLTLVG